MPESAAQKRAKKKYRANTLETVSFEVRKGKREELKARASQFGLSLAKFLLVAAESYGKGDSAGVSSDAAHASDA